MLLIITRTFKEAVKNFLRNGWMTLATVSILILSLYVVSVLYVVTYSVDNILKGVQEKVNISVYFKMDVSEDDILVIKDKMKVENQNIKAIEYVSREKALENFKRDNADEPIILQSLEEIGDNPLLSALVIRANEHDQYQGVADYVSNAEFKDEVSRINYGKNKEIIDKLNSIIGTIRRVGISLGIIFAVISVLVTFNTVRMTIYAQRREIEIMRLVGASNTYIRLPFILEGVTYGVVAAIVSMLVLFVTLKFMTPYVSSVVPSENLVAFYRSHFGQIIGIQLLIGVVLGIFSSVIAMRKYLKV